jgi:hypothetical protein
VILDGLPGLYGLKFVCMSTCKQGQSYLILYKLVGSMIVMMTKQASKS